MRGCGRSRFVLIAALTLGITRAEDGVAYFEKYIRPVLSEKCYECHSAQAAKKKGGLLLDTRQGVLAGGNTGPAIVPGDPGKSLLIEAIRQKNEDLKMPPKDKLSAEQISHFETWIKMGAPDPRDGATTDVRQRLTLAAAKGFWSFKPLSDPKPPKVKGGSWARTPIDQFVLAKMKEHDLKPLGDADRRTLIRRAAFDLTGLPPSPDEISAFVNDRSSTETAFTKLVDRLLASPHYGERWGRHWMDVVRYADTAGDNSDYPIPQAYLYRNYIIESLNADKPFDQFTREQIAGDLMPHENLQQRNEQVIATGYIAMSRRFGSIVDGYPYHLTIEDTIDNMGKTFLGLSMGCARCHDHKFDPISNEDYYGLYGIFQSTRYAFPGIELLKVQKDFVPLIPPEELDKVLGPHRAKEKEFEDAYNKANAAHRAAENEKSKLQEQVAKSSAEDQKKLTMQLLELEQKIIKLRDQMNGAQAKLEGHQRSVPKIPNAYAVYDGKPADARVQQKGDPQKPGATVPRRFPEVLGGAKLAPEAASKSSGRLQLAEWITGRENPLFARVMVNRVWQHHFGRGLVATPNDFGNRGLPPSHPELLDWLASRFIADGYSLKGLHRLILQSRVYQLSSASDSTNSSSDPDNIWLWKFSRRRLDAETIRDTVMFVSGTLDLAPQTRQHPFAPMEKWGYTQHAPFKDTYPTTKRSIYMMQRRLTSLPFFTSFDGPDPNATTARRDSSITSVQALFWLNDPLIHDQSKAFACHLVEEKADDAARVQWAFQATLGRAPEKEERRSALEFLTEAREKFHQGGRSRAQAEQMALESFARTLFRLNEFIYVD